MHKETKEITKIVLHAKKMAKAAPPKRDERAFAQPIAWPVHCTVGPGLEGAIACESKIGYVNGSEGLLIYRGYDIFDLCAYSTFEEVSYLLLYGELPTASQLKKFKKELVLYRRIPNTLRALMAFPVENMNAMAGLRLGTTLLRQENTYVDSVSYTSDFSVTIGADEDSIPMETKPTGEKHAIYEFEKAKKMLRPKGMNESLHTPVGYKACCCLLSGSASLAAAVGRMRQKLLPFEPDPRLSHAGNLLYSITGEVPTPVEERIMNIALILHADHGMNASTFAAMVVASTLSDIYMAVGSGIAALTGPLHGGANEMVLHMLKEIKTPGNVKRWFQTARKKKTKIMGFGHRVYKAYDPRARILGPLVEYLVREKNDPELTRLFSIAEALEKKVVATLGAEKGIFPNVDFYSGLVYSGLGIPVDLYTPIFAVSRVAGWTARVMEYLEHNRIFRPRAMYVGPFDKRYTPLAKRG